MMAAVLEIDIPNLSTLAYEDDMNESAATLTITSATFSWGKRFQEYSSRAAKRGLNFDPKKTELMHLSINRYYRTDTSILLPIQTLSSLSLVRPSPQIKIHGVIFDPTLSFLLHAQHASSRGVQVLGSLCYLRKDGIGVKPNVARQLALTKVLPAMLWASPAWWNGTSYVLNILENTYHRIARWITGLPVMTSIHKLLTCAHLPPLRIHLDYLSSEYAAGVLFNPSGHNLDSLLRYQPFHLLFIYFISFNVIQPMWLCRQILRHKIADMSERRKQANKQKKTKQHT
jgi:hypothetical protein